MASAHFKGAFNFGIILDDGPTSRLSDIYKEIAGKVKNGTHIERPKVKKSKRSIKSYEESMESEIESDGKDLLVDNFKDQ